jgi:hypothetical protein
MVMVAQGEPGGQLPCFAAAGMIAIAIRALARASSLRRLMMTDIGLDRIFSFSKMAAALQRVPREVFLRPYNGVVSSRVTAATLLGFGFRLRVR